MPRKKTVKKLTAETYESYAIRINDWTTRYTLCANFEETWGKGPLYDYLTIEIRGEALAPSKILEKKVCVFICANREFDTQILASEKKDQPPHAIGFISGRGQRCDFTVFVPFQSLPAIISMLHAQKSYGLIFGGTQLKYGKGTIRSVSFVGEEEFLEGY